LGSFFYTDARCGWWDEGLCETQQKCCVLCCVFYAGCILLRFLFLFKNKTQQKRCAKISNAAKLGLASDAAFSLRCFSFSICCALVAACVLLLRFVAFCVRCVFIFFLGDVVYIIF